ncbi:MAG: DUF1360 domain-containing protein [Acidothermaceae bacterium]
MEQVRATARTFAREQQSEYSQGHDRPLGGYLKVMGTYAGLVGGLSGLTWKRRRQLPSTIAPWDVALIAIATHKLSRVVAKDSVVSPLRAAFTRYEGVSGPAELEEDVRAEGVGKSIGELLTCPFCLAQWIATGFGFGLVLAPRATRLVASIMAARAASDYLQFAYAAAQHVAEKE